LYSGSANALHGFLSEEERLVSSILARTTISAGASHSTDKHFSDWGKAYWEIKSAVEALARDRRIYNQEATDGDVLVDPYLYTEKHFQVGGLPDLKECSTTD